MDEFYVFALVFFVFHCCVLFFDTFFKSCSFHPYIYFLHNTGLNVRPFRVSWFTTCFNRQIQKWGTWKPRLQTAWFTAGTWVSIILMPLSLLLLIHTMIVALKNYFQISKASSSVIFVEPMVPGWNIPSSDIGYYLFTLLVSSVVHEVGHAVAAVREDVHVLGFSFYLFFIIPVAMTHIEQLEKVQPMKKLRVLCAGVWHNIFLAIFAAIIATVLPWMLYPFFEFGTGVQIEILKEGSPLAGSGGLMVGDKITQLNDCSVRGSTSWHECLFHMLNEPNHGFCVSDIFVKEHDESVPSKHMADGAVSCCASDSPKHLCFEYIEDENEPLALPQHSCLKARDVVELFSGQCRKASDCASSSLHCFRPSLENSTKLMRIYRSSEHPVVIFLGHPSIIYSNVKVTDFITWYSFLPSSIPEGLTKICHFLTIFSTGVAILNIIPCFYFDGQSIICTLLDVFLDKRVPLPSVRYAISLCITLIGSGILILYILVMLFAAF